MKARQLSGFSFLWHMITIRAELIAMNTQVQLILFIFFAIIFNVIEIVPLAVTLVAILPWLIFTRNMHFYRLLKRLKWFFIILLLIYMFTTPGEYILAWPFTFQPTYEGVWMGFAQVLRIALIIAMLSIIYQQNTKKALVSGLYACMQPLSYIGVDVDRFAVRLWLTLNYVDAPGNHMKITTIDHLFDAVHQTLTEDDQQQTMVTIEQQEYRLSDYFMVAIVGLLLVYVVLQA